MSTGVVEEVLNRYLGLTIKPGDSALVDFLFCREHTPRELEDFLGCWDIEVAGGHKALFLSYLMQRRPDLEFPSYVGPRLKGLLMRYRFDNLRLAAHFSRIVREFNSTGIVPLLIKGGAMRFLRPELPRNMGDMDVVLASKTEYARAMDIVRNMPAYEFEESTHAFDVHEKDSSAGVLDVHWRIEVLQEKETGSVDRLFDGAEEHEVFGARAYIPSPERMMFILLQNLAKNLKFKCSISGVLYSIFDADWIGKSKTDFNWKEVSSLARAFNAESQVALAGMYLNRLVPGLIPPEIVENESFKKAFEEECRLCLFMDEYYLPAKMTCKKLRFPRSLGSWKDFSFYIRTELSHRYYRWVKRDAQRIARFMSGRERGDNAC